MTQYLFVAGILMVAFSFGGLVALALTAVERQHGQFHIMLERDAAKNRSLWETAQGNAEAAEARKDAQFYAAVGRQNSIEEEFGGIRVPVGDAALVAGATYAGRVLVEDDAPVAPQSSEWIAAIGAEQQKCQAALLDPNTDAKDFNRYYAASQSLSWALNRDGFVSPSSTIEDGTCCFHRTDPGSEFDIMQAEPMEAMTA